MLEARGWTSDPGAYLERIWRPVVERCWPLVLAATLVTGCAASGKQAQPASKPRPTSTTGPGAAPTTSAPARHVFVIVMENNSAAEALAEPYTSTLAREFALLTNYHAVSHPSAPNYLALTSGSTWDRQDDGYVALPPDDIGHQLTLAGRSWRAYMEDLPEDCLQDTGTYAVKHNPFAYYGGQCPPQVVPLTQLPVDLAGATPSFVWITPNGCHDGHDCSAATADRWLSQVVPEIMASSAWREGGVLFVTWDEDDGSADNQVVTLVVSPTLRPTRPNDPYNHYSLFATVQDLLGLPRLPAVASTPAVMLCC